MRRRVLAAVAAALTGLLVLAGCSPSFRTDQEVRQGLEVRGGDEQVVRAVFPPPGRGDSQDEILRGFVRAGAASDGDYETARQYLTPDAIKVWAPEGEVVIYSTSTPLTVNAKADNAAEISTAVEATIDTNGRYVSAAVGTRRAMTVEFARIGGEWRISNLPKEFGRWITTSDVGGLFRPYTVNYIASDRRALVPDRRWFARDHLPTRLARAQLQPPPAYLAGSVRNDIPPGSRLTADSVSVSDGVARVEITGRVPTDQTQRENVWAQLVATLLQDPTIQGVRIRIGDTSLELPGVELPVRTVADVGFPSLSPPNLGRPVIRRGANLFILPSTSIIDRDPRRSGHVDIQPNFRSLALSADGAELAAVDPDGQGLSRFRGTTRYEMAFFGTSVGHPAYDTRGYLWAGAIGLDDQSANRLWAFDVRSDPATSDPVTAKPIGAGWLDKRLVVEAKPSFDGDRVAILHTAVNGKDPRIDIAGVHRGRAGEPVRLSEPRRLAVNLTALAGLVWLSDLTLATLGQRSGSSEKRRPHIISVDGEEQALAEAPTATSITSTGGERDIVLTTSIGSVLSRAGQQWISLGTGTDVAVPAR
ncbi:hypothetical protein N802_18485 [Knoellia sinensis KCTC 19936]|uniref:GerMN domain-containing protein n=1 Tax=Knoellia sinensis KCTC 19936 TaxID=1385520 RepID=A0A0A0J557_9MICO|nr:GerMN domain-containing protein [Knoellia sinensis]KGN32353.1 hypothetical protein N802_18485 [Knoellia sinensis KCTC 19936]